MTQTDLPQASANHSAPLRGDRMRLIQTVLFIVGGALLPLGIVVICLGWYGMAHTPYQYNQLVYIVSGGMLGVGITLMGGFLYFGAWIARTAADQRDANRHLSEALLTVADSLARSSATAYGSRANGRPALVTAAGSTTVHRADCGLIEGRADLVPATPGAPELTACRVCNPELAYV